jgi:bacillithiol synthase
MRIPLEHYPGMSRFVLDWLRGDARATKFLPRSSDALQRLERQPEARRSPELASALVASNRRWGLFVKPQVEQWASGKAVTIIAGQQTGFAGGPLYTLAKIATVLKMKREIERAGAPATVMFWLATEDHDFDEVAQLNVPVRTVSRDVNRQLDLLCVRATRGVESKLAVGNLPVPEPLVTELLSLYGLQRPQWLREGISFADSFAELIASIFEGEVVLVDSLLPELRRAGSPLFDSIFDQWTDIERTVAARSAELAAGGYSPQIVPREGESYSLLFELDENLERHVIDKPRAIEAPERISTSALTRPLLQDFVLQPDVFVGGPGEVSYYAQTAPLHEMLGIEMPRVALRGHTLVAPKRIVRFIERYGIKPEEIFTSPDELLAEREPKGVAEIRRESDSAKRELIRHIEKIGDIALPAEHALARAINRSIGHIEYHFGKLTERAVRGLVRKDKERYAAAKELLATLYPDRHVQDRIVAWFPYWLQFGRDLIDRMIEDIAPDSAAFNILGL